MAFGWHLVVHRYANKDTRSKHLYYLNLRGILPIKLNITDTNTYWVRYSIQDFKHQNFMITDIPYHTRPLIIPQILCRFHKEEGALPLLLKVKYFMKFVSMNKLVMFTQNSVLSSPELTRTDCLTRRKIIYEKKHRSYNKSTRSSWAVTIFNIFKQYGFNNSHYSAVMQFLLYQDWGRISVYRVSEFNSSCVKLKLSMPTNINM